MMKDIAFACAACAALAACASEPEPQPDPALVARLAEAARPEAPKAESPAKKTPKLEKADRIVTAIDRAEPDRLAAPAEALLAR